MRDTDNERFENGLIDHVLKNEVIRNGLAQALGFAGGPGTAVNQATELFTSLRMYLLSNFRQQLSQAYVERGVIKNLVDVPVDDAFRGRIKIHSKQLDETQLEELMLWLEGDLFDAESDDFDTEKATAKKLVVAQARKWARLYGGGGVLIINGDDPTTPLRPKMMKEGDPLDFRDVDLWELYYSRTNVPAYNFDDIDGTEEFYDYYGERIHKSRVMKLKGFQSPSFVRYHLRGWGVSAVEPCVAEISQFLRTNNLAYEVLREFKLDVYQIKNLASTLFALNGDEKVKKRIELANKGKSFDDAIVLDSEDKFEQKQVSFAGLAEMNKEFRVHLSSALRMPMLKLWGLSAAGLNNSSEEELEVYNSMVEATERTPSKPVLVKMVALECQVRYGFIPTDLRIEQEPLRMLSAEQEENVKNAKFNRCAQARTMGEMDSKEFKEACNREQLLPVQVDVNRETLEMEPADGEGDAGGGDDGETVKNALADRHMLEQFTGPRIVSVGLMAGDLLLTGKRKDNGLWTSPGGHMDPGETLEEAACREVFEEAGIEIKPADLILVGAEKVTSHRTGAEIVVFAYLAKVAKEKASSVNDPDDEVSEWKWVKIDPGTPELQPAARHAKYDHVVAAALAQIGGI